MDAQPPPSSMKQIIVTKLGNNFRDVTEVVQVPIPSPGPRQILVKTRYVSINASDILFTAGFYKHGQEPPFLAGIEAMGEIVATGESSRYQVGQIVVFFKFGTFSEYLVVDDDTIVLANPLPSIDPVALNLHSFTTASIALDKKCDLKKGETVLVTGAAGATGQFAVQLAKLEGCHVIGTCSSEEKVEYLKDIGCDRPINYTQESVDDVLKKEYPNGVNVVYESVGNEMFDTALNNLATFGRILVLGAISTYEKEGDVANPTSKLPIPFTLLNKSASVSGFYLFHYSEIIPAKIEEFFKMITSGHLKAAVDNGKNSAKGPFKGIEAVYDAVEYMFTKKNVGKVVVAIG